MSLESEHHTQTAPGTSPGFERLENFAVDGHRLRVHLAQNIIAKFTPVMQGEFFGGWSVYSSNGHFDDGWHTGHEYFREQGGREVFDVERARKMGIKKEVAYYVPTEICFGYLAEIMCAVSDLGLHPRRARVTLIKAGGTTVWHRDAQDHQYALRLHIPLITNDRCFFETREERYHMPADGSGYLVRVNCMHRAYNEGLADRYHLIMQVWDCKGVSKYNTFTL